MENTHSSRLLDQEARALLARLGRLQPFALDMPMVPAASISPQAQAAIELHMSQSKVRVREMVQRFLEHLRSPHGADATPEDSQRKFTLLRLRFNAVLTQFDIFSDVLAQRSQHGTGVWIAGLDALANDALQPVVPYAELPPVVCYLDRGAGAAIRRARTRLPGGDENPVAIIRVPRERMVGSGIASSVLHEAGHQAAAQLDLVNPLRQAIVSRQHLEVEHAGAWRMWERWISEIVADFWAVSLLGITATTGLLAVVSLPRAFVFRVALDDPHPFPWIRVKLSCAMGDAIYPHPQWARLADTWGRMYPKTDLPPRLREFVDMLEDHMPAFVELLTGFRPESLEGRSLPEILPVHERAPHQLQALSDEWRRIPGSAGRARPTLAFAVIGQGRADGKRSPEKESSQLTELLTTWALSANLETSSGCAQRVLAAARRTPPPQPHQSFVSGESYAIH